MRKSLLRLMLVIAILIDIVLALITFVNPEKALGLFHVAFNAETSFLAFVIACFCMIISAICAYTIALINRKNDQYKMLVYILGFWWLGLGLAIYFVFNRTENLLLDSLKGLLLLIAEYAYSKTKSLKQVAVAG